MANCPIFKCAASTMPIAYARSQNHIHKPLLGKGIIDNIDAIRCGIRFSGLVSVSMGRIYGTIEWIESLGPNYWEVYWRRREAGMIENGFYVCPQSLLLNNERSSPDQMRDVISHRRILQSHCASMCFNRWDMSQHELLSHIFTHSDNHLEIFRVLTWKALFISIRLVHYNR